MAGELDEPDLLALLGPLLEKAARQRWKRLLSTPTGRRKALERSPDFDGRFARRVENRDAYSAPILRELRRLGAGESCTVVPFYSSLDPWTAPLADTLRDLLKGPGPAEGEAHVVVVCVAGRLAFTQFDEYRMILCRPS